MRVPLHDGETISCYYDGFHDVVMWVPVGQVSVYDWDQSFEKGINFFLAHETGKTAWVNDTKALACVGDNIVQHLDKRANIPLMGLGRIVHVAFVQPDNFIAHGSVWNYIAMTHNKGRPVSTGVFPSLNDVWEWLGQARGERV